MLDTGSGKYATFTFYISQLILYLFFFNLILIFYFLIGNFQGFQDNTQLMILGILRFASLAYLVLGFLYLIQTIAEMILFKRSSPGFLIFLLASVLIIGPVHLVLIFTGRLFF